MLCDDAFLGVYILHCCDGSFYTGWSINIAARVKRHKEGKASRYTRARLPVRLIYFEKLESRKEAMQREVAIKKMNRKDKEKLIFVASMQSYQDPIYF